MASRGNLSKLSAAQQTQIMAERRAYAGELRRRQRRARRRARGRLAPATAQQPDPPEVTRLPERALDASELSMPMNMPHTLITPEQPIAVRCADLSRTATIDRLQAELRRAFEVAGAVQQTRG